MKLAYWLRDDGACGYYRVQLPLWTMAMHDKTLKLLELAKGVRAEKTLEALDADVTLVPRLASKQITEFYREWQKEGKRLVIDFDDDMFNVSPMSPHYTDFGVEEVEMEIKGKTVKVWEDGKNINIKANQKKLDDAKRSCNEADMVTVTTDILADVYREFNDNVVVLPNCIDTNLWQRLPLVKTDEIRLVWFGGFSHYEDWFEISEAVRIVLNRHKNVKLVLMGSKWDATLKGIRPEQIEFHEWVKTPAYPYKAAILNPDIAVIPLRDTSFNHCKSAIKWIEMAGLQVPSVTSHISPYKEVATEDNGVFIADNDTEAWIEGLEYLIKNEDKRIEMGKEAHEYVKRNFDINNKWKLWQIAYEGVLQWRFQQPLRSSV